MKIDEILRKSESLNRRLDYSHIYESCNLKEKKSPTTRPIYNSFYRSNLRHNEEGYKDNFNNFNLEYEDFLGDYEEFEELLSNFTSNVIEDMDLSEYTFKDYYTHAIPDSDKLKKLNKVYHKYEANLYKMIFTYNQLDDIFRKLDRNYSDLFNKSKKEKAFNKLKAAEKAMKDSIESFLMNVKLLRNLWGNITNIWGEKLTNEYLDSRVIRSKANRVSANDIIKLTNPNFEGFIK